MNENLTTLNEYITYLSDKLQKPAEFVYDMLLRQVYFEGAIAGFYALFGLAFVFTGFYLYKRIKSWIATLRDYDQREWNGFQFLPLGLGNVIGWVMFSFQIENILQVIINPHWYMIKIAARLVSGGN